MNTYSKFRPTEFDRAGAFLPDQGNWLVVPVSQNRDSDCLSQSNFDTALEMLGGEYEDRLEVHRFGHWGPGWFEIIIINPDCADLVIQAMIIEEKLAKYPVLNEDDFSFRVYEKASQWWNDCGLRERISICAKYDVSIFAARRAGEIPERVDISYLAE
jgi:hypothetical protein